MYTMLAYHDLLRYYDVVTKGDYWFVGIKWWGKKALISYSMPNRLWIYVEMTEFIFVTYTA